MVFCHIFLRMASQLKLYMGNFLIFKLMWVYFQIFLNEIFPLKNNIKNIKFYFKILILIDVTNLLLVVKVLNLLDTSS